MLARVLVQVPAEFVTPARIHRICSNLAIEYSPIFEAFGPTPAGRMLAPWLYRFDGLGLTWIEVDLVACGAVHA